MVPYYARVTNRRTGHVAERQVPSVENGAQQLLILMSAGGWQGDREAALTDLRAGSAVSFKGRDYQVSEDS